MDICRILENLNSHIQSQKMSRLWEGQRSIFIALFNFLKTGNLLGYLKLPCGIGKTNLAIELANAGQFKKVLVLVPTLTLVEQTDTRFRQFGEGITSIGNFTGTQKKMDDRLTIATYHSIQRLKEFPVDPLSFDLVIWDEVHEALSVARQKIMNFFGPKTIHLGLTASDKYNDHKQVSNLMPLITSMEIEEAIKLGLLSAVQCWIAETNIDITRIKIRNRDYDLKAQKRYIDVVRRNQAAVDIYSKFLTDQTCLVTCINIGHAISVAEMFKKSGIACEAVWGSNNENSISRKELRRRLDDFKAGKIKVLTTVDLIDKGFDNTHMTALINLRITSSVVKATQRAGRVLRLFSHEDNSLPFVAKMITTEGGKLATVVDFLDECKNHAFRPVLFSDVLKMAAIFPDSMQPKQGNGEKRTYLWPTEDDGIRISLVTNLIQVAKITSRMTNFEQVPFTHRQGVIFLPM